jgi:hypothetical protein
MDHLESLQGGWAVGANSLGGQGLGRFRASLAFDGIGRSR